MQVKDAITLMEYLKYNSEIVANDAPIVKYTMDHGKKCMCIYAGNSVTLYIHQKSSNVFDVVYIINDTYYFIEVIEGQDTNTIIIKILNYLYNIKMYD